ncbi:hypothetical protein B9H04_14800 [Halorubrum ezzemoulense DSM 17463]|uniref:DUF1998 domain-containing protein n=1 Tax=Halorubrum ezzemoulense DSM 17463 TaxID=1121945 RepID=A0A1X4G9V5_HALEZ|nr:hypothetical protein [Halorubrum ezzemoulense]OSO93939.1 hypothetical protein B9H04_14800 [Halorubrum ezzemoulense DSM 17463]
MSMKRSRHQILYQFLPGNTFDYSDKRGIWQVNRLETTDASGQVDREYIVDRVFARAKNWEGGEQGFTSNKTGHYDFAAPDEVMARPFPTTFYCTSCQKAHGYFSADDLSGKNQALKCDRSGCNGDLKQYQFVSVHSCGEIRRLYPRKCPDHGDQHIVLDTQDSQRAQNFHWRCKICGWDTRVSYSQNCDCDYVPPSADDPDDDKMYTTVHRAGSTYYPHYLTTVNLHASGIGHLRGSEDGSRKAIAKQLGLSDSPLKSVDMDEGIEGAEIDDDRKIEVYQTEEEVESLDEAEDWLRAHGEIDSQTVGESITDLIDLKADDDSFEMTDAGDELLQYVLSLEELTAHTLEDLEEDARQQGFPRKADTIATYSDDLDRLGLKDVRVIEDFPVQTFVYGYTRGGREEDEAKLNAFSQNASSGDGTPIFVDTSETEATQFDLDPAVVLLWLAVNIPETSDERAVRGDITLPELPADPSDADIERARTTIEELSRAEQWAFLLNHLDPVDQYGRFETSTDDTVEGKVTKYVFEMLHTLSHVLLKQASTISGFDRTNLSEFLFPRALSLVIYTNNREEFNIGGMTTMVEQQLDDLLGQARAHGNECMMDPVCSQRDGACLSCLHVSEISCSYFNQVLCRDYLFGSRPNTDRDIEGFWRL